MSNQDGLTPDNQSGNPQPNDPNVLPSGATVLPSGAAIGDTAADADAPKKISRRTLVTAGVGGAAVVAAGAWAGFTFLRPNTTANGLQVLEPWGDREILIPTPSGACEAPLIIAYENKLFEQAGLNVVLKKQGDGENVTEAVGSGTYTASNGIFFNFLGPIYNGTPVKLSGGLHFGCLDLYVRSSDSAITEVADLKGKKIGVGNLQGSATNFFSLDLLDAGINSSPEAGEVEWVVITNDLLPKALEDETVDAIAVGGGFLPIIQAVEEGWAKLLSTNNAGDAAASVNSDQPCCAVVFNNDFVEQDPVTAAKLVEVWSEGSRWAGDNLEETARIQVEGSYVTGTVEEVVQVLQTVTFTPSPESLRTSLLPGIKKYIQTGFLPSDTDADLLADKAFVDLGLNF